jgi:pimeloyl-ACP methyl ester carboxylesterase
MTLQLNGRTVDYVEQGAGPCIVFVPGSFSNTAAWRPIVDLLKDRFRTVATSLMGYGGTEEIRAADNESAVPQTEAVEAVVSHTGSAVHMVGHSWGGTIALAVALRGKVRLSSLVLFEANPCDVLRQSGDEETYNAVRQMWAAYVKAYAAGEADAARRVADFWEGKGSFESMPPRVRDYMIRTTPTNILDWSAHWAFRTTLAEYASIKIPTLLVYGGETHAAMRNAAHILSRHIPAAKLAEVPLARHFLITTHPRECAALIEGHVSAAETARAN